MQRLTIHKPPVANLIDAEKYHGGFGAGTQFPLRVINESPLWKNDYSNWFQNG
jgi:hypothetical protein